MLPTEKARVYKSIPDSKKTSKDCYYFRPTELVHKTALIEPQYLYLLDTKATIPVQSWYIEAEKELKYSKFGLCHMQVEGFHCKIIASTDLSLGFPIIPDYLVQDFIKYPNMEIQSVSFSSDGKSVSAKWKGDVVEHNLRVPSYENNKEKEFPNVLWLLCGQTKFDRENYGDKMNIVTSGNKETIDKKLEELVSTNEWLGLFTIPVEELAMKSKSTQERDSHYQYRNLDITASEEEWCVCGTDKGVNGYRLSGVLEWCYDKEDATRMLSKMSQYARFSNLSIDCLKPKQKIQPELIAILRNCFKMKINSVTFPAGSFDVEYELPCDDKNYVTFHRGSNNPDITDTLLVNKIRTTEQPIWKDWYMTINYHA
jgi:hypothetical protein